MIRFVDLRGQDTGNRFMFWDTVSDSPIATDPEALEGIAWETWQELEEQIQGRWPEAYVQRLREIAPPWTREKADEHAELSHEEGAPCILCQIQAGGANNRHEGFSCLSRSELVSLLMGET